LAALVPLPAWASELDLQIPAIPVLLVCLIAMRSEAPPS